MTGGTERACHAEAARQRSETRREGGSNSVVESQPSKLLVAGSIPVSRSKPERPLERLAASALNQDAYGDELADLSRGLT